jgi:hypothetical protein
LRQDFLSNVELSVKLSLLREGDKDIKKRGFAALSTLDCLATGG